MSEQDVGGHSTVICTYAWLSLALLRTRSSIYEVSLYLNHHAVLLRRSVKDCWVSGGLDEVMRMVSGSH
jgi:hypothetical protein